MNEKFLCGTTGIIFVTLLLNININYLLKVAKIFTFLFSGIAVFIVGNLFEIFFPSAMKTSKKVFF